MELHRLALEHEPEPVVAATVDAAAEYEEEVRTIQGMRKRRERLAGELLRLDEEILWREHALGMEGD